MDRRDVPRRRARPREHRPRPQRAEQLERPEDGRPRDVTALVTRPDDVGDREGKEER